MLKTCQLVNILGGTVVYEAIKTIMLGLLFLFSLLIGKDRFIPFKFFFFFFNGRRVFGILLLTICSIDSNTIFKKMLKERREKERKKKDKS